MASEEDAPKIIVDSDWKSQAQAEKAKLAEAEAEAEAKGAQSGQGQLPPADFRTMVGMLATQAVMYLGGMVHPETGGAVVDLEYSKHSIDLLGVLEEKTKGNLSEEEASELSGALNELRMRWVEISKMVAEQAAKGQGDGASGPIVS